MSQPNVVIVVLDTARAKNFSCYGYCKGTTPFLEELCSSKSNIFMNAFTPAIWTIPSHASILTGTYPSQHGALNLHRFLDDRYITLAELLSDMNYDTVLFSNNGFLSVKEFGLSRGFRQVEGFNYPKNRLTKGLYKGWRLLRQSDDSGAFATNRFVRHWLNSRNDSKKPFFLLLNYMEAHAPYIHIPNKYLRMYVGRSERKLLKTINQDTQKYLTRTLEMTEEDFVILRSVYDAQISYLDFIIRDLVTVLRARGVWDNSLVIITSDHGDLIGEHRLVHHSYSVYEELIKVPLIIKLPGNSDNGRSYDYLVSLVDVFSTSAKLLDIRDDRLVDQLQGCNLFDEPEDEKRQYVFVECERPKNEFAETYPGFDFSVYDRQLLAIRSRRYKYIWASDNRHELFDLVKDPSEQHNVAEQMPEMAGKMGRRLKEWYDSFEKYDMNGGSDIPLDAEIKQRLQALGYF